MCSQHMRPRSPSRTPASSSVASGASTPRSGVSERSTPRNVTVSDEREERTYCPQSRLIETPTAQQLIALVRSPVAPASEGSRAYHIYGEKAG